MDERVWWYMPDKQYVAQQPYSWDSAYRFWPEVSNGWWIPEGMATVTPLSAR